MCKTAAGVILCCAQAAEFLLEGCNAGLFKNLISRLAVIKQHRTCITRGHDIADG